MACRGSYIGLMRHLRISPGGRLANQMIQFMIAKKLQKLVPGLVIHGYDLPRWRLSAPSPEHLRAAGNNSSAHLHLGWKTTMNDGRIKIGYKIFRPACAFVWAGEVYQRRCR